MNWVSRIDEGRKHPLGDAFLIQDFVISYALFTETVILILNEYEHVIKNIRI